jgi:tagatose 6-phosphate kinase
MITTITLNAAIDKTYFVERLELAKVTRVPRVLSTPGGKGINVARVLHQLGADVRASGFVGGKNGEYIAEQLEVQGIASDFVKVTGESRLCLNIIDGNRQSTELLEPGPTVTTENLASMREKVRLLAAKSSLLVMSGSLPAGVPDHYYLELIDIAKTAGARVLLDTSKGPLLRGIEGSPYFIKPNEDEVKALLSAGHSSEEELYEQVLTLNRRGIAYVVVTLGAEGSVAGVEGELYRIQAPRLEAVNTVGCGDSFVAGMAYALEQGYGPEDALQLATAVGSANALTAEAGNIRREDVDRLLSQILIHQI